MPQVRPPERNEAMRMWLESDGKLTIQNIAIQLGQNPGTVRGWKSKDCWDDALEEKRKAAGKAAVRKKTDGRKGNQNAKGHGAPKGNRSGVGHGAPKGNKNGLKHGAFERFAYRYMDDEEKEIARETEIDGVEQELLNTLAFLKARELRLMKRVAALREIGEKQKGLVIQSMSKTKSEKRMGLWRTENGEYVKETGTGMYDGEWLDETTTNTSSLEDALNHLESELSKVQAQKVKVLVQLDTMHTNRERLEIERIRAQGENEQSKLANDWVEALLSLYTDGPDAGGEDE